MSVIVVACSLVTLSRPCPAEDLPNTGGAAASPPAATAPSAAVPVNTTTPYSVLLPWVGAWQWTGDSTFIMALDHKLNVQYGPLFTGTYRLISERAIELTLHGNDGQKPAPVVFQMEFVEGGRLMVWRQTAGTLVFRRVVQLLSPAPASVEKSSGSDRSASPSGAPVSDDPSLDVKNFGRR